jgi:two-component system CheB/CheR fusion protein
MTSDRHWCQQLLDELTGYAVFLIDSRGAIRSWHPGVRAVFGFEEAEFLGQPYEMMFTADDRARSVAQRDLAEAAHRGRSAAERCYVRKDGSRVLGVTLLTALRGTGGVAAVVQERTGSAASARMLEGERRRADRASHESHEKDALMAVLAHELRAPLNAIRGWLQIALNGSLPPQRLDDTLRRVIGSTDRMVRLVDDLADASRVMSGALPLQLARVDLAAVVRHAAAELAATAEEKRLAMHVDIAGRPIVLGDRARLEQIAGNLLSNAVKYTPAGGRITASVRRDGNVATVEISDNGRGIAAEDLPRIFQRFRRSGDARQSEPGLGLGLWITRELVAAHGGSVSVTSAGPGRGATARLTLPQAPEDRNAGARAQTDDTLAGGDSATDSPPEHSP